MCSFSPSIGGDTSMMMSSSLICSKRGRRMKRPLNIIVFTKLPLSLVGSFFFWYIPEFWQLEKSTIPEFDIFHTWAGQELIRRPPYVSRFWRPYRVFHPNANWAQHCLTSAIVRHCIWKLISPWAQFFLCFLPLTHEGSHREVYQDFQPSFTLSVGGSKGC